VPQAKNFGAPVSSFANLPSPDELYIFPLPVPGPLASERIPGAAPVPNTFSHRLMAQDPIRTKSGTVRIADSKNFPASITIAAALVEILPGGMRGLIRHPNTDEWQYYIDGKGRMGVFASSGDARTFDYQAGDVGFVPFAMGHYIENPAPRRCASSRCSRAATTPTSRSTAGWRSRRPSWCRERSSSTRP
jgi:oxalate decarboxylase